MKFCHDDVMLRPYEPHTLSEYEDKPCEPSQINGTGSNKQQCNKAVDLSTVYFQIYPTEII